MSHLTNIGNHIVMVRQSWNCLLSTLGIPILVRHYLYIESALDDPMCVNMDGNDLASWWCHDMETYSALLALCEGNPLITHGFHSLQNFHVSFVVSLNKLLIKQTKQGAMFSQNILDFSTRITHIALHLTHCGLVTLYGKIDLGQHWFR